MKHAAKALVQTAIPAVDIHTDAIYVSLTIGDNDQIIARKNTVLNIRKRRITASGETKI
jgi:hypothetical protein